MGLIHCFNTAFCFVEAILLRAFRRFFPLCQTSNDSKRSAKQPSDVAFNSRKFFMTEVAASEVNSSTYKSKFSILNSHESKGAAVAGYYASDILD